MRRRQIARVFLLEFFVSRVLDLCRGAERGALNDDPFGIHGYESCMRDPYGKALTPEVHGKRVNLLAYRFGSVSHVKPLDCLLPRPLDGDGRRGVFVSQAPLKATLRPCERT